MRQIKCDNYNSDANGQYYDVMKKISLDCSEDMRKLGERIIWESVNMINTPPPCEFDAVAIGSTARGEATPYSDLEYLFLVDRQTDDVMHYFELLALTSYFIMGNIGETKLSYMHVKELHGWFDDKAKNGFKIDGLSPGAGNIPTGNSANNRNHFIVTPEQLADRYKGILDNPHPKDALRGDLTSMLTYTNSLYSYQNDQKKLLSRFEKLTKGHSKNQKRKDMNMNMLKTDARKFNFVPDDRLRERGFNVDVKKELYRFPSILLLDICIVCECAESTSWETLEALAQSGKVSQDLCKALKFLLAAATYIRLSTYLHHDSHDDRIALTQTLTDAKAKIENNGSAQRWFLPCELFSTICTIMIPLKQCIQEKSFDHQQLAQLSVKSDPWWTHVTTLYYSGNYTQALSVLKERCTDLCINPVESVLQLFSSLPYSIYYAVFITSETLLWCGEYRAALQLYQYMNDNNISDERMRIAGCLLSLGDNNKAIEILTSIKYISDSVYLSLGNAYESTCQHEKAELCYLQALQVEYNKTSAEPLTDYYGNPLTTDCDIQDKVNLMSAASPEDRFTMITHITPGIIACLVSLGSIYRKQKKYSTAEAYYMKSLQFIHDLYGEGAAVIYAAHTLSNLAGNYRDMKQYKNAEDYYLQALSIYRQISKGDDSLRIAETLANLADNYNDMKKYNKAADYYLQVLSMFRQISQGADSMEIAKTLNNLGRNYSYMKQYNKAEDYYLQALSMNSQISQGADSVDIHVATTLNNLANNYRHMEHYDKAEKYYLRALSRYRKISQGAYSVDIANTLCNRGNNYHSVGNEIRAREVWAQALDIYIRLDPSNPTIERIQKCLSSSH